MSRSKRKSPTRKRSPRKRSGSYSVLERATFWARRFGIGAAIIIITLWVGSWVWLSGSVQRSLHWTNQQIYAVTASAGFVVNDILVEGRENTDADVLRALLNIERGDPLLAFDPQEAKTLIERIGWVRVAHVERHLPNVIYISLEERQPLALWQHKGKLKLLDSEGKIIEAGNLKNFKDLPLLVGADVQEIAPEFMVLVQAEPDLLVKMEAASRIGGRRWDLKLKNGVTVKLPADDEALALRRLVKAQEEDGLWDKDITVIDLREEKRITVRTRPGAVQEYKANYIESNKSI